MLGRFLPKQKTFFELFGKAAAKLVLAAEEFYSLVNNPTNVLALAKKINDYERQADTIALANYRLLHKTFITPFDRHDIHILITHLDNIIDDINRLAQRFVIYKFQTLPLPIIQLAELNFQVTEKVRDAVDKLESLKNQDRIMEISKDVDQLENKAEAVLLIGLEQLFAEEKNCKELIKLKEVYEQIKEIINTGQDATNIIQSIMLEYA